MLNSKNIGKIVKKQQETVKSNNNVTKTSKEQYRAVKNNKEQ